MTLTAPTASLLQRRACALDPGSCRVMGILNVTPDSFSDGGQFLATENAVRHGMQLWSAGAHLVDVGGESSRPGAERVRVDTELARVVPVIEQLSSRGVAVSIDTTRAAVAEAAVRSGAALVNDISGGLADPSMARTVARLDVPWVLTHWRGHSRNMHYGDVVAEVAAELDARVRDAVAAGVARELLILDPGLGFAKNSEHNWHLLGHLDRLTASGMPVLVGASRKRFLSEAVNDASLAPSDRDAATLATTVVAAQAGAWAVRVHDVRSSIEALRVLRRLPAGDIDEPSGDVSARQRHFAGPGADKFGAAPTTH